MTLKKSRINENIEDKARELMKAISEAEGVEYQLLLICAGDENDANTVMCVPRDPSRTQSDIKSFVPLVNAVSTWFLTITGQIRHE